MQKRLHSFSFAVTATLGLALILPAAPAQASEVVKLARLVITGKRLSAERMEPLAAQKSAPLAKSAPSPMPRLHAQTESEPSVLAPASAGQDAPARASSVHARGVLSFL